MSEKTFDKALSLIKQAGCEQITFLGGEPTLHPLLPLFVHKAAENGMLSVIVSNGSGYSDPFFDSIEGIKHAVVLNISIEGSTATTHDKVTRTQGSFEKLLNGIRLAKLRRFNVSAIVTLCPINKNELASVIDLLNSMGVNGMLINFANRPLNVPYSDADYLTVKQFCEQIVDSVGSSDYSLNISIGPPLPLCHLSPAFKGLIEKQKMHLNNGCQLLSGNAITINATGHVLLCNHLTEVKTVNINNVNSFSEFQSFLAEIDIQVRKLMRKYPKNKCNTCNESSICFGGCPLLWLS
jgi:radical SAM protein with 4Fe4S-binding SPASM domain